MAGRRVRPSRMRELDRLGFPEIAKLYVTRAGSIQGLCQMLFEPRSEGERVGVAPFYAWLKQNNLEGAWRLTVKLRNEMLNEAEVVMPNGFDWRKWAFDAQMSSTFARAKEGPES
jgi:hypothetical protein